MGKLPTLAKILNQKHGVAIENFPGFGNGAYWPSINTGVDPSHHGRCYRAQVVPPDYTIEPFLEDRDMKVPPFWKGLEDKGYEVAIIDPVETGMGMLSKGVEIVRWIVHGRTGPAASSPGRAHASSRLGHATDGPGSARIDVQAGHGAARR